MSLIMNFMMCLVGCKTLWFTNTFTQPTEEQFSTLVGDALTLPGKKRITATTLRHLTQTLWRDFVSTKGTFLTDALRELLERLCAEGMQSSSNAVDQYYDDSLEDREIWIMMQHWATFKEFVKRDHQAKKTWKHVNWLDQALDIEGLTLQCLS